MLNVGFNAAIQRFRELFRLFVSSSPWWLGFATLVISGRHQGDEVLKSTFRMMFSGIDMKYREMSVLYGGAVILLGIF